MKKIKIQDLEDRQILWLRNYKHPLLKNAYQKCVRLNCRDILVARITNCAQKVLCNDDTVYI